MHTGSSRGSSILSLLHARLGESFHRAKMQARIQGACGHGHVYGHGLRARNSDHGNAHEYVYRHDANESATLFSNARARTQYPLPKCHSPQYLARSCGPAVSGPPHQARY